MEDYKKITKDIVKEAAEVTEIGEKFLEKLKAYINKFKEIAENEDFLTVFNEDEDAIKAIERADKLIEGLNEFI